MFKFGSTCIDLTKSFTARESKKVALIPAPETGIKETSTSEELTV